MGTDGMFTVDCRLLYVALGRKLSRPGLGCSCPVEAGAHPPAEVHGLKSASTRVPYRPACLAREAAVSGGILNPESEAPSAGTGAPHFLGVFRVMACVFLGWGQGTATPQKPSVSVSKGQA